MADRMETGESSETMHTMSNQVQTENQAEPPGRSRRLGFEVLLILAGLAVVVVGSALVLRWREAQFVGHGLAATYWEGQDFDGRIFRKAVEPRIDFEDGRNPHFRRDRFSVEWTGTIVFPRPGRYGFATNSDDGSMVEIDGERIVDNWGTHGLQLRQDAKLFESGPHTLRIRYFQAGVGAKMRLLWNPAGRRGGLEYVPPTLLFPEAPDLADLERAMAVPPRDAPALGLLGLLGLGFLALVLRRPLWRWVRRLRNPGARLDLGLFLLLFAAALGLRLYDLSEAGRTWDEDVYWTAGRNFMQNLLDLDFRWESWAWNNEHPAFAKWIYGPATLLSDRFDQARAVSALLGALTCALLFLVGRDLLGRRPGLVAALLAIGMPHLVAHHKIIGLETPTALFYMLTLWFFSRSLHRPRPDGLPSSPEAAAPPPEANDPHHLLSALCAGLLVGTRVSNLSVFVVLAALYLVTYRRPILSQGRLPMPVTLGLFPLIVGLTFFIIWPYLWENPMKHLGQMLSHWDPDKYLEWFLGEKRPPAAYYFPLYFAVTTPAAALVGLALFIPRALLRRDRAHLTLALWFLGPFIVMASPLARDGVRYLYPAIPAACLMIAAGLEGLGEGAAALLRRPRLRTWLPAPLGTGLAIYLIFSGFTVHPYYLDYYNELVGGPARVAETHRFEIGWWGEGIKEACDTISRMAPKGAKVHAYVHPLHVVDLRPDLQRTESFADADFVMWNDLFNSRPELPDHQIVHVVRAAGAPLVWVFKRQGPAAAKEIKP